MPVISFAHKTTHWIFCCVAGLSLTMCTGDLNQPAVSSNMATLAAPAGKSPSMRGVCWTASDSLGGECMVPVKKLSVNWISQTPFGWQDAHNKPEIGMSFKTGYLWGELDHGLSYTTSIAHEKGIKTMLKPHLWMTGRQGKWRSEISMDSEEDWKKWFENYGIFILHYAELAEKTGMESLCIGTELHMSIKERPDDWRALIKKIRQVYSGQITYAANFYEEYEDLTFWDDLDFIGIQGYFPLTKSENPSLEELKAGWEEHVKAIKKVSDKYGKKVVFTEVGYKSTRDAAIKPWEWPDRRSASYADTSNLTQQRCYEAMFQTFADKEWVDGFFIWKWHPRLSMATPEQLAASKRSNFPAIGFTPQKKPAEQTMAKWYKKWE